MNTSPKLYDSFSGTMDQPVWILAISGLNDALKVMHQVAVGRPGSYFIFDTDAQSIAAQVDTQPCGERVSHRELIELDRGESPRLL